MKALSLPHLARYPTYLAALLAIDLLAIWLFSGSVYGDALADVSLVIVPIAAQTGIVVNSRRWRKPINYTSRLVGALGVYGLHIWGIVVSGANEDGFAGMLPVLCVVTLFIVGSVFLQILFRLGEFDVREESTD